MMWPRGTVGDPLWAVLIPPRLERFREITGLGGARLAADFTGWSKYALLAGDSVFLFPREPGGVGRFEHELSVYRALEPAGLAVVLPRVVRQWRDDAVYPFPFAEVTRLPGQRPADPARLFGQLGQVLARCHMVTPPGLPGARLPAHHQRPHMRWLRRALNPATSSDAAAEAAHRLGRPDRLPAWRQRLAAAATQDHVLVHGDIHEDQLLAADGQLTGILDWETARIDHPLWDFDLSPKPAGQTGHDILERYRPWRSSPPGPADEGAVDHRVHASKDADC